MRSLLRGFQLMVGYVGPVAAPLGIVSGGGAASFDELREAIDAAWIMEREPDDEGPRVAVISPSLRGSFFFSRDEAERRILLCFPGSEPSVVKRAVRHLENRVRAQVTKSQCRRRNWVHGWKED